MCLALWFGAVAGRQAASEEGGPWMIFRSEVVSQQEQGGLETESWTIARVMNRGIEEAACSGV